MVGTPLMMGRELAHLFCFPVCNSVLRPILTPDVCSRGGPRSPTESWSAQWALSMMRELTLWLPCCVAASMVLDLRLGPSP